MLAFAVARVSVVDALAWLRLSGKEQRGDGGRRDCSVHRRSTLRGDGRKSNSPSCQPGPGLRLQPRTEAKVPAGHALRVSRERLWLPDHADPEPEPRINLVIEPV